MKKVIILAVALIFVLGLASVAFASIVNSAHDLSSATWNDETDRSGEICIVCHTPHNSDTGTTGAPLWNRFVSTATYTPYSNANTLNASLDTTFSGISALCMSCHDGTVALDAYGTSRATALGTATLNTGDAYLSTDLRDDHPVSFSFNNALVASDGELHTVAEVDGGNANGVQLFNGKVECASCHDVHAGSASFFLVSGDNSDSKLCLTCHDK